VQLATIIRSSALLGAVALLVALPMTAHAEDPVDLSGAYVLDTTDTVTADIPRIKTSLDSLFNDTGIGLFVVYVDRFTGADTAAEWAGESALLSGLGSRDALLAIAIVDREYYVSVDDAFALSDDSLSQLEQDALIPQLRNDNWADGAIDFADAMRAYVLSNEGGSVTGGGTGDGTESGTSDGTGGESDAGGGIPIWPLFAAGGAAIGGVAIYRFARRGRRSDTVPTGQLTQKQLDVRAGSLLVELDNAIKTSEQELDFAVAQFGEKATAEFSATLKMASAHVSEAFGLRQKLDDAIHDTPEQQREWTTRTIELCEQADAALDAQADAFDTLRALEKTAPEVIVTVDEAATSATTLIDAAKASLAKLAKAYSSAAISTVTGNVEQAEKLLALSTRAIADGHTAIAAGSMSEAAVAVRSAQAATGQAGALLAAIDSLESRLTTASEQLDSSVTELRDDIAEATAAPPSHSSADLARVAAAAQSVLDSAIGDGSRDPVATLTRLHDSSAALASALENVREREAQIQKARASLDTAITNARSQIASGEQYLASRRGAVGTEARTRLTEANRNLTSAVELSQKDPVAALAAAQQASHLAEAGTRLAQSDVDMFSPSASSARSSSSSGMGDAIIGGILGGLLNGGSGGGYQGGSSSGGSWGSSGSFGGSSRSSGFSGSSRRSSSGSSGRRGGGGRF